MAIDKTPDQKTIMDVGEMPKAHRGIVRGIMDPRDAERRAAEEVAAMSMQDMNLTEIAHTLTFGLIGKAPELAAKDDNPVEAARAAAKAASAQGTDEQRRQQEQALKTLMAQQDAKKPGREV